MLETLGVDLWFSDELGAGGGKRRPGWHGVAEVFCSRRYVAVSVPRRRRTTQHFREVVHEVAHLLRWVQTDVPPARQNELTVCSDAILLAQYFRLGQDTVDALRDELVEEMEQRRRRRST
jgi:hypothetical protein